MSALDTLRVIFQLASLTYKTVRKIAAIKEAHHEVRECARRTARKLREMHTHVAALCAHHRIQYVHHSILSSCIFDERELHADATHLLELLRSTSRARLLFSAKSLAAQAQRVEQRAFALDRHL